MQGQSGKGRKAPPASVTQQVLCRGSLTSLPDAAELKLQLLLAADLIKRLEQLQTLAQVRCMMGSSSSSSCMNAVMRLPCMMVSSV